MSIDIDRARARALLPERPADGHKGTFGHVLVIGGSRGMTGAVVMASLAAARSGVGLVTAGVPRPLGDVVAANFLVGMSLMLEATAEETIARGALGTALEAARNKQAVVLGPGLSHHPETCAFALDFIRRCPTPLLIDADGLNCLSADVNAVGRVEGPVVLTPHPGEMGRLTGLSVREIQADRERAALELARRTGAVVVLKGARTVVASGEGVAVNTTGNSGMATGGSGDVLSGIVGGLLAQGLGGREAAELGVYVHGLSGDRMARQWSQRGLIATDLIEGLSDAWLELEGESGQ